MTETCGTWTQVKAVPRLQAGVRSNTAAPQAPGLGTYLLQLHAAAPNKGSLDMEI